MGLLNGRCHVRRLIADATVGFAAYRGTAPGRSRDGRLDHAGTLSCLELATRPRLLAGPALTCSPNLRPDRRRRLLSPALASEADAPAGVGTSMALRPIPALASVSERRLTSGRSELAFPRPFATLVHVSDPVANRPWWMSPSPGRPRRRRSDEVRKLTVGPWLRGLGPECRWPQSQVVGWRWLRGSGTPGKLWARCRVVGGSVDSAADHFRRSDSRAGGTRVHSSEAGGGGPVVVPPG